MSDRELFRLTWDLLQRYKNQYKTKGDVLAFVAESQDICGAAQGTEYFELAQDMCNSIALYCEGVNK